MATLGMLSKAFVIFVKTDTVELKKAQKKET